MGAFERVGQFGDREAGSRQRVEIGLNEILLHIAAVGIDAGNPWNRSHLRTDDPVLDRAQIGSFGQFGRQTLALGGEVGDVRLPAGLSVEDICLLSIRLEERAAGTECVSTVKSRWA